MRFENRVFDILAKQLDASRAVTNGSVALFHLLRQRSPLLQQSQ